MVYGASFAASKYADAIQRRREERARNMTLGDLEREIRDYEQTIDSSGFFKRIFPFIDYFLREGCEMRNQYQANKKILEKRTSSE